MNNNKSTYSKKLLNPKWQRKRLQVMERDGFCCVICYESESTLNVHHSRYVSGREPWEYDNSELLTLCDNCHREHHALIDEAWDILHEGLHVTGWHANEILSLGTALHTLKRSHCREIVLSAIKRFIKNADFQKSVIDLYLDSLKESAP